MKKNKPLAVLALAFAAALAVPLVTRASTGDIVDIRVVDTDAMVFNTNRNPGASNLCLPTNPLTAGDELYIRVRMLVRNWEDVKAGMGHIAPKTWYLTSSTYVPDEDKAKLGLWIGNSLRYASYVQLGPKYLAPSINIRESGKLAYDEDGNPNDEWEYYTDFYFCYRVQPGDIGLPVKLANSAGNGPAAALDTDVNYNLKLDPHCSLKNDDGDDARFWYCSKSLDIDWPTTTSIIWSDGRPDRAVQDYDLSQEWACVKTIDFDADQYPGEAWRKVYLGMNAASVSAPALVVGGGALAEATTVYIWSSAEGVVVPVASGANTIIDVDGKKVLKVIVPAGAEGVTFTLQGVDTAAVGATATIYLSPTQSAVYRPTGELADVTVSRTVKVVRAPIDFDEVNGEGQPYVPGDVWRYVYLGSSEAPNTTPEIKIRENASAEATTVYIWSADETVMVPVASGANTIDTSTGKTVLKVPVAAGATGATFAMKGAAVGATTTVYVSPMLSAVDLAPDKLAEIADPRKIEVVAAPAPKISIALKRGGITKEEQSVIADSDYLATKATLVFSTPTPCTTDVTLDLSATISGGSSLTTIYNDNILRICDSGSSSVLDGTPLTVTFPAGKYTVEKDIHILGASASTENGIKFSHSSAEVATAGSCTLYVLRGGDEHPIAVTSFSPDNSKPLECEPGVAKTFNLKLDDTYRSLNDTTTGYTLYLRNSDTWDELQTKPNVKANPARKLILWPITFDKSYDGMSVDIYAISPDGLTQTEPVTYTISVKDSKQVIVTPVETGVYTIGEGHTYAMALALNQAFSGTSAKYIFLEGVTAADKALFTSPQTTTGASVGPNAPYTASTSAMFLDGKAGGTSVGINAYLADSQTDPTAKTAGWSPGSITVTVTNEPPKAGMISIGGSPVMVAKGGTLPDPVSSGVAKTFSITASDVDADLNATGADAFQVKWSIDGLEYITKGNPNGMLVTNVFQSAKDKAPVYVWLKDKDMEWQPEPDFYFYVNVKEKPHVSIDSTAIGGVFMERDVNVSQVYVRLSEAATTQVVVRLTVSDVADGGFMRLRTVPGSVTNVYKEVGGELVVDPNAYDLVFNAGATEKRLIVSEMDGTDGTLAGMDLNAKVITDTKNADGEKWCDFYTAAEYLTIQVENEAPRPIRPTLDEAAYTNMNASANTPYPVTYACSDVPADMASNIVVEILVDGTLAFTTNINDSSAYTYSVEFSNEGAHVVEISFTDKDQMSSHRTLNFYVQTSKALQLSAHGPAPAAGSSGGYSSHYSLAAGLGAGRVFAGDVGPQKVWNFVHTYSFGITVSTADAYAYGYKADDSFDDGTLKPSPDKGIDEYGDWQKGQVFGDGDGESKYYNYTRQHPWGKPGYDSFLYAWACNNSASTSTTGGDSQTSASLFVSPAAGGTLPIPLPDADDDNSKSLPMQYWEAVFSREFLKSDNCGDINSDGIPDVVVKRYGMGIFDAKGEIIKTDGEGDLTDVKGFNDDVDKHGAASPDFLPSTAISAYGSLIPGIAGTWDLEFGAKLEIRGYHDGLNDAMKLLGFDVQPDIVYAEEVDGEWKWTENCTISELEWYAWTEYAAAHGLSPGVWTNSSGSVMWSPERPTNLGLDDTDDDGFDDGYEYYFWYRAHVGYMENGVHKRQTGRRYDPKNPGDGILIAAEEIELIMDPRVAYNPEGAKTRDTDNDGLPDLIEFEIGTNPFDFDTDGDGLPDGWELMIAGLNPLLVQSASDGVNDAERNYDGDAMAITSYRLESADIAPIQKHPEQVQYTTFAVVDAKGDSDGVQWYATKADVALKTNTVQMWSFKLADGTEAVSAVKPLLTADGRLAGALDRGIAFSATSETVVEVDDSDPENPVTNEISVVTRGWPMYMAAGTLVDAASVADDAVDVNALAFAAAIAESDANAAWVYGKGTNDMSRGAVADTAAVYGCLAIGRKKAVPANAVLCALPSTARDVALLHYLVYQQFGFDPRTAWSPKSPLAARWGKNLNNDTVEGVIEVRPGGYCSSPSRTRAYATYDEFLVYSFFVNNGCSMETPKISGSAPYMAKTWFALTTNPQGPNEPGNITLDLADSGEGDVAKEYYFGRDSDGGADTDGDGVPDGWELYVMAGPKKGGAFVFAPPYAGFKTALSASTTMPKSYLSPFIDSAKSNDTNNQIYLGGSINDDGLNEFQEFESTDAMNYYASVYDGATTTIVHDGEWKWLNKFFPSNPWTIDTDGDGLSDSVEKGNFVYGTPADDGLLRSIPGGGLNPNSVDTDVDGLPDGWEVQFKGKTQFPGDLPAVLAEKGNKAKDANGNEIGNYLQGLVDGMDGTVKDAFSYPIIAAGVDGVTNSIGIVSVDGVAQVVNRDYDRDGLENWQEYQTGMMRCWRYDDPLSPWVPIPSSDYFDGDVFSPDLDALSARYDIEIADMDDFWVKTLVDKTSPIYNPRLVTDVSSGAQYLSPVTNAWDACFIDTNLDIKRHAVYYWFYNRVGDTEIKDLWAPRLPSPPRTSPRRYACCSPIDPDSDRDGMDDGYELFHGMNPMLGASGGRLDSLGPCDLVFDTWSTDSEAAFEAWGSGGSKNYWQLRPWMTPRLNGYDFEVFPWLTGIIDADPDGDGLPNQTEALLPKVNAPELHSDPTPLWMTDTSYDYSLVNRFFRLPTRYLGALSYGETFLDGETVREFKDFDCWLPASLEAPAHFGQFAPDSWKLAGAGEPNWMFSFEENEGYDSDHDGLSDIAEKEGKYRKATDVLDADSPRRRQAMYFQGPERPSILQTMPEIEEMYPVNRIGYPDDMKFRTYTVECWVMPESLDDSVIVERAVWISVENPADEEYMRKNFQIGIKDGRWYTKFDPNTTLYGDAVTAVSVTDAAAGKWTHLAATYDCSDLVLYVNGVAEVTVRSGLLPAYGSSAVVVRPHMEYKTDFEQEYWADLEHRLFAVIVGASAKTRADGAANGLMLDLTQGVGWSGYTKFFKGWVDEIRVWDGARTAAEIADAMNVRFTSAMAEDNRAKFFELWSRGWRRDGKDENGKAYELPAELCYHWSFDSVFGADNENAVATAPHGFNDARAVASRAEGYEIPWWRDILASYTGAVYSDSAWVPWIPSTVAHLPRFDGTTLDSVYWSDDFMGDVAGTYRFARTAEPASRWTQMARHGVTTREYYTPGERHFVVNLAASVGGSGQDSLFDFTGRHLNQCGDDLIPLGGAYARACDNDTDLWDEQGASSNWEITGTDGDGDGLPDWWEQYADENYRRAGMDPSEEIGWETIISYNGLEITAGEAYLRDLARGAYMNELGETVVGSTAYEQRGDEDGSGVPDWWEEMYGITGESGLDDHDNDGLPNYVEYMLSEVFKFEGVTFSPINPRSVDNYTLDYFYRVGSLYVGEIFTDHDQVDDDWEDKYQTLDDGITPFASRFAYDASADVDEDGWSNRSEARYSNMVMPIVANAQNHYTAADGLLADYPIPTLSLTLRYNGVRQTEVNTAPIVVRVTRSVRAGAEPDAEFLIGAVSENAGGTGQDSTKATESSTSYTRTIGKWADRHILGTLTPGNVQLNSLSFECCYDPSSVVYSWAVRIVGIVGGFTYQSKRGSRSEYDYDKRKYGDDNVKLLSMDDGYGELQGLELRTDETGSVATWIHNASGLVLGTINLKTGEFDIDFGVLKGGYTYSSSNETQIASLEDQTYRIAYASQPSVGLPRKLYLGAADVGHVREGANDIVAFADIDNNGAFTPGEPYGIVQNVDVSWKGVAAEVELTDESPVTPRFNVFSTGTVLVSTTNVVEGSGESGGSLGSVPTRVRVVRWKLDDTPIYSMAVEPRVIFDKVMDPRAVTTLTEADFLDADTHDLDWDNFYREVAQSAGVRFGNFRVVKADYLVVVGDGDVISWRSGDDTNKVALASKQVITRRFGANRVIPQPVSPGSVSPTSSGMGIVSTASPTFAWTIDSPDSEAYTAFRIVVTNAAGLVYDSGVRRAPARDGDGAYRWAAPLYVDDITTSNKVFANKSTYGWRVSMYNAKFRADSYSAAAPFYLEVQTNGYSTGTAKVGVRYFGPDASFAGKVVRVQAFASPDFTGQPLAAGYVKDVSTLAKTGDEVAANCTVTGLPAGKYYLKAFIDSNGNGVCDDWESSGYLCARDGTSADWLNPTTITVGPDVGASDVAAIYLEDADTDYDGLPDSWEYASYGSLTAKGIELLSETPAGEQLLNANLVSALELRENSKSPAAGLATRVHAKLSNAGTLALALGVKTSGYGTFAAAISGSVSDSLAEDGVKITSLDFVDGKVVITVDTETDEGAPLTGPLVENAPAKSSNGGLQVVCKVYWKQSLADTQWTLVKSETITAGAGEVEIDAGEAMNGTSGFYKVVVEEK